jgi:hypothetical protein
MYKGRKMKTFQRLLGILLVAMASAGLFVACGGEEGQNDCIDSADCAADELCNLETEQCGFACTEDADCLEGEETCEAVGDGGSVCVATAAGNNGNNGNNGTTCADDSECTEPGEVCDLDTNTCGPEPSGCTDDSDCDQAAGEFCSTADNECVTGSEVNYQYARIQDDSNGADLCADASDDDPGSDIYGVELKKTDDQGTVESYWAQWVNYDNIDDTTHTNNLADPTGVIEGQPLDLTGACPESFDSTTVVALGCEGSMLVEFVNSAGEVQFIEDLDTITVYEWGSQCGSTGEQDQWTVSVCEEGSDFNAAECKGEVPQTGGTGLDDVTVQLSTGS